MKLDTKTFYILPKPESLILEYIDSILDNRTHA